MTSIYVDADACPVKTEIYRVAARYGLNVYVVSNSYLGVPRDPRIELVVVSDGFDAADNVMVITKSVPAKPSSTNTKILLFHPEKRFSSSAMDPCPA